MAKPLQCHDCLRSSWQVRQMHVCLPSAGRSNTMTTAPIRTSTDKAEYGNTLHSAAKYGKISVYLNHGNGGHNVNVGILNSRGGSETTQSVSRYHFAGYQEKRTGRLQARREVANHSRRLAKMARYSQK